MRVSVFAHNAELTDTDLRRMMALGADHLDLGGDREMPGVADLGYPALAGVKALRRRQRSFDIDINRMTRPDFTTKFMTDQPEGEQGLENM